MARNKEQLREIGFALEKWLRQYPGLGVAGVICDAVSRQVTRPTNILLLGFTAETGARLLIEHGEMLDRVAKQELKERGGLYVPESFLDMNKIKS